MTLCSPAHAVESVSPPGVEAVVVDAEVNTVITNDGR